MSHLGYGANEYGTPISKHKCDACGTEFTVCPAKKPADRGWENCLGPTCSSYDPSRDVDKMLDEGGQVVMEPIVKGPLIGQA